MHFAYRPELWESLFEMVALAAVTLTGFLAVALSMNVRALVANPAHLARAREALISLMVLLVVSIFVLIPEQGPLPLGIELLAISVVVLGISLRLQSSTLNRLHHTHRGSWRRRLLGLNGATLSIAIGGVGLVTGRLGGLLWLLPNILIGLVWSTYNAWSLLLREAEPGGVESGEPARPDSGR